MANKNNEGLTPEIRKKIWDLYYKGYFIWEIARELDLTEYQVVRCLGL